MQGLEVFDQDTANALQNLEVLAATAQQICSPQSVHDRVSDKLELVCAVKIGQQFSTRVDVLSPELVAELEKLQDDVPSFDPAEAVAIVEREIGAPINTRYEEFDTTPIAAASLGQVMLLDLDILMPISHIACARIPTCIRRQGFFHHCCILQEGQVLSWCIVMMHSELSGVC